MVGVYDPQAAALLGVISAIPAAILVIADAAAPGIIASWGDVAAAGVVFSLFVWLLTVHIPAREKASEARQDARDLANEKRMDRIQADFITALQARDETSRINAASGHGAMQRIMDFQRDVVDSNNKKIEAFDKLHDSIREMCAKIDRHQQRSDNVA